MNPKPKLFSFIFGVAWFCSLFVFIPMVINAKDFQGNCLLNARGNRLSSDSFVLLVPFYLMLNLWCILFTAFISEKQKLPFCL